MHSITRKQNSLTTIHKEIKQLGTDAMIVVQYCLAKQNCIPKKPTLTTERTTVPLTDVIVLHDW